MFIDRKDELEALEERIKSKAPEFVVLYGRRRVGKTELIKEFQKDKQHVYYLCRKEDDKVQMQRILDSVAELFSERKPAINDWEDFFRYLYEKTKQKKIVFTLDEFPFLIQSNKSIPSYFQVGWDEYLKNGKIFMILCGSSIGMMEKKVLSYKSPLYGRRTGQIKLEPLKFKDCVLFFNRTGFSDIIYAYSILGNIPLYLLQYDENIGLYENIKRFMRKDNILYEEPAFLLKEELRDTYNYSLIMEKIASGASRVNEIATKTGMEMYKLPKYLGVLMQLNFIEKIYPITEKPKTRHTLYRLKDNFFRFWFRFIYPNKTSIEEGNTEKVFDEIKRGLDSYTGHIFEQISSEFLKELNKKKKLPFSFSNIGKWWGHYKAGQERKEVEIDIVALNEKTKEILFCECKWQDKVNAEKILNELVEKARHVDWNRNNRKEYFAVFARSFSKKTKGCLLLDLNSLKNINKI